ncbi:MAG: glycosyltransferase family 4 protein [Candidatus Krumholzibacteria bacterium]|nr:glycosyltransferase family 4 protein [Candidatus Krumholzibacteria bacterium]
MKRKVLIIVENLPVPFDTRVWKEATTLAESGYQVFVICPKGKGYEKRRETIEGVKIWRHPMPPEGKDAAGYLLEYGLAFLREFFLAWWIFLRHRYHVIQGCNPPDNIYLIARSLRLFGVKYVFDHHDVMPELYEAKYGRRDFLYRVQSWMERRTFAAADVSMATNETYRQVAIERGGMDPDSVFVVRNGPNLDTFQPVEPVESRRQGRKFLVGYVGTIAEQEGLDILLAAALHCKELGRDDVHFTCIGGGPGLDELRRMKTDMGLDERVDFTGRVSDEELIEILSTADVCGNPDKPSAMNDMSTMIKIMEYMALAKPIVQFDLKEGRFSAGEASLYADNEGDLARNFAEKILWLLDHPEEARRMGEAGRQRVETELAWQYSKPRLLAAYDKVFD